MIGIVVSRADPVSTRIGEALLDRVDWRERDESGETVRRYGHFELRIFDRLHLDLADVATAFDDPDAIIFVSRHSGETGPLLSTHFPGNVSRAEFGGSPMEIPSAATVILRTLFDTLAASAPAGYDVGIECTHHGPSRVGAPCLFAELGSGPDEWSDPTAADALARAVLSLPAGPITSERTVVGFGDRHYAPRFERLLRETDWHVGHVAADWAIAELEDDADRRHIIRQMFARSRARVALLIGDQPAIGEIIESLGHRVVSETWLRETSGTSLDVVTIVEDMLMPIGRGARFGERTDVAPGSITRSKLPESLLRIAHAIDQEAVIASVRAHTVAYGTEEGGNRLTGPIALPEGASVHDVVLGFVPILEEEFQSVQVTDDELVCVGSVFDPERAHVLGVPEGPAFGRLAEGNPVTMDDRTIRPEDVMRTEVHRIPLTEP